MKRRNQGKIAVLMTVALLSSSLSGGMELKAAKKASLATKKLTMQVGAKKTISIKNKKKGAKYSFVSSAKAIAKVNAKGVVSAVKKGTAKITVKEKAKKTRKLGVVKVVVNAKAKKDTNPSSTAVASCTPVATQTAEVTSVPSSTPVVSGAPENTNAPLASPEATETPIVTPDPTEAPTTTPEATVDPYTKEVFRVTLKDGDYEEVEGATCTVGMRYFTADVSGTYFNGKTLNAGSNVRKAYKDGTITDCAKFILAGEDDKGEDCRIFIQDEGVENEGNITSTPIIITDSESLEWMETADIQGRMTINAEGNRVVTYYWNESNTEKKNPPEVKMPDTSRKYTKEIFTFNIKPGNTDHVSSESEAKAQMIHFTGSSNCANFKGDVTSDCVDTRLQYPGMVQTLSARYILDGVDAKGNPCKIYVENNGIDTGVMTTEPIIITDCPDYAWIETAPLHGTVSWETGLTIHMWTTEDDE